MTTFSDALAGIGRYVLLMGRVLTRPDRWRMFFRQYVTEMFQLGYNSIGIVLIISFFIGAVICLQIKLNIQSPWMPRMVVGYTTREIMLLEFSSSIMCLILAGKVGSNIASELGTMRITQQIDALDIMGVNSANYLILPKVAGLMTIMPILVTFSVASGVCWEPQLCLNSTKDSAISSINGSSGVDLSRQWCMLSSSPPFPPIRAIPLSAVLSKWVRQVPMPSCSAAY